MLERDVEKMLVCECRRRGWLCIKHGVDGWPDRIIVTRCGTVFWAELKSDTGRPSKRQVSKITALNGHGQKAGFVVGIAGVETLLRDLEMLDGVG